MTTGKDGPQMKYEPWVITRLKALGIPEPVSEYKFVLIGAGASITAGRNTSWRWRLKAGSGTTGGTTGRSAS